VICESDTNVIATQIYAAPRPAGPQRIRYNGRMKKDDINSHWFPYAVAAAVSVAIAIGLWFVATWY
jgi:hypothetical protein